MSVPSIKTIKEFLDVEQNEAFTIREAMKIADAEYGRARADAVDTALDVIDDILDAHGVEAIRGNYHVSNYYYDAVALYVNMGDSYNGTVLYDTEKEKFYVTTYGDWVERNERRYKIQ